MATDMKMQGFYLDASNEAKLATHSKEQKLSKSEIVRRSLSLYLSLHQDHAGAMTAVYALAKKKSLDPNYVIDQAIKKAVPKKYFKN